VEQILDSAARKGLQHPLALSSAYAPIGEPPFTNYTGDFVGVLDYFWFTTESLGVSKVLQPVDKDAVRLTRLPNPHIHSDHISILGEFFFKTSNAATEVSTNSQVPSNTTS